MVLRLLENVKKAPKRDSKMYQMAWEYVLIFQEKMPQTPPPLSYKKAF